MRAFTFVISQTTNLLLAGVSLGPFPNYKSSFISGAAGELFEFADSESPISKRLDDSLRKIVKYGAKITFVASIDDQLVSMEVRSFLAIKVYPTLIFF
jgi:hypothetical protein